MISIKKHLFIVFCLLCTGLTHCANSQQETTYPEVEGYTTEVQISHYFQIPTHDGDIYTFSDNNDEFLHFIVPQKDYHRDLEIDKLEFTPEDRMSILDISTTQIMKDVDNVVDLTKLSHLSVGQTGYVLILFKDPKNNNQKTFIKLHIKRIED